MSGIWDRIKGILGWVKREPDKKEDDRVMYIIAGLGNPTREYEKTGIMWDLRSLMCWPTCWVPRLRRRSLRDVTEGESSAVRRCCC